MPYTFILYQEKWGVGRTDFVLKKKNNFEHLIMVTSCCVRATDVQVRQRRNLDSPPLICLASDFFMYIPSPTHTSYHLILILFS